MPRKSREIRSLDIIEAAAQGLTLAEMGRNWGIHHSSISRAMSRPDIRNELEAMRTQALLQSQSGFIELLRLAIEQLRETFHSPLVDRRTKAQIACRLLQIGLTQGMVPEQGITAVLNLSVQEGVKEEGSQTIVFPQPSKEDHHD
jgi:hypothetical protein